MRRRRRRGPVSAPPRAERLEVRFHDDREPVVYVNAFYWPYDGGNSVDVLDVHGNVLISHQGEVLNTLVVPYQGDTAGALVGS